MRRGITLQGFDGRAARVLLINARGQQRVLARLRVNLVQPRKRAFCRAGTEVRGSFKPVKALPLEDRSKRAGVIADVSLRGMAGWGVGQWATHKSEGGVGWT